MPAGSLRNACEDRLGRLDLPHRFSENDLIDAVASLAGRTIDCEPVDMRGAFSCGLRKRYANREVIYYEKNASALHRRQIIAHELSHILWEHKGEIDLADLMSDEELAGLMDWSVLGVSARTSYETDAEIEAEMMATLILQRMYRGTVMPAPRPSAADERWDAIFA
ncbi:ImmA/IrrE family metallo-endopeptidase [Kitasatospora sp. NPDC127116]|uniref:ImmA/IrrE family metallo-endopeptidase n=1 Tax=Kitasatospora sp. NPDC127116 TaxID=3345367 RepID=UPI00362C46A8